MKRPERNYRIVQFEGGRRQYVCERCLEEKKERTFGSRDGITGHLDRKHGLKPWGPIEIQAAEDRALRQTPFTREQLTEIGRPYRGEMMIARLLTTIDHRDAEIDYLRKQVRPAWWKRMLSGGDPRVSLLFALLSIGLVLALCLILWRVL